MTRFFSVKLTIFLAGQRNSQELFISLKYLKFFRSIVKRICESSVANIGIYKSPVLNRITSEFSVLANSYVSSLLLTPVSCTTTQKCLHVVHTKRQDTVCERPIVSTRLSWVRAPKNGILWFQVEIRSGKHYLPFLQAVFIWKNTKHTASK